VAWTQPKFLVVPTRRVAILMDPWLSTSLTIKHPAVWEFCVREKDFLWSCGVCFYDEILSLGIPFGILICA
jgi:hypothetical protein